MVFSHDGDNGVPFCWLNYLSGTFGVDMEVGRVIRGPAFFLHVIYDSCYVSAVLTALKTVRYTKHTCTLAKVHIMASNL
jgi:hypothetical protein